MLSPGDSFHGEPMAQPFDFLGIAISEIEYPRGVAWNLVDSQLVKKLPSLVKHPGLNSGFMITQYACLRLLLRTKFCHPDQRRLYPIL